MHRRVSFAPVWWLPLALIALLWGSRPAQAAPPFQEPAINLPAPLYYISQFRQQVVRLEQDGVASHTITRESSPVTALDVAPDGSKLAYVSDGRLIEADANGLNRVVKYDGSGVCTVGQPVYSPDGARIAFACNGVNLIPSGPDAGEEAVTLLVADDPIPADGAFGSDARFYFPQSWSPDGVHLLAEYRYVPDGGGFAILAPDTNVQVDVVPDPEAPEDVVRRGAVAWKPESTGFYVASAMFMFDTAGLTFVDAGSGVAQSILTANDSPSPDAPANLVHGPHVSGGGELQAFLWVVTSLPPNDDGYRLAAVAPDTGEQTPLNEIAYQDIGAVLWSADDSGAILLTDYSYTGAGLTGSFTWAPVAGEAIPLAVAGSAPRWGSPDVAATAPEAAEIAAIFEQSLDLDAVRGSAEFPAFDPSVAFPVQGADGATYWIAHTTGTRSFNPDMPHVVAVYARDGDGWREVSRLELAGAQEGVTAGPDYLSDGSVSPVQIGAGGDTTSENTQLWLHVEGGAGAHSGVCGILRLTAVDALQTLVQELDGFNPSPGACTVEDVNGDGANEVVLNATDPYVFCYACGVRWINYSVARWAGEQFETVELQPLPAAAPAELSSRNDELLRLVQGGLWKGALDLLDSPLAAGAPITASVATTGTAAGADAITATVEITATATATVSDPSGVYAWNKALVRLTGEARRDDANNPEHPFPLLGKLFYGDYPAALDVLAAYSAADLFAQPSAVVSGTVAAGWEASLSDWITTTTSAAIDVNPQLAGAFFLRGYGKWLGGVTAATTGDLAPEAAPTTDVAIDPAVLDAAVADIRAALELAPDPLYAESLALLTGEEVSLPAAPVTGTQPLTETAAISPTTATTATATTATATATTAGAPGGAGRIFYSTVQDGVDRIFALAFGSENATLEEVLADARQPSLQPGGQRLAYQSTRDDMLGLGGFDLDTGNRFNFTTNLEDSLPRWNPAGNRLAFSSTRFGDGRARIYLAWAQDARFATDEALDLGEGSDPDWSPDGGRLVYKGCDAAGANCGLWTMALDGSDRQPLTDNPSDARGRWSPDGSRVVFMSDGRDGNWDIYSVPVTSAEAEAGAEAGAEMGAVTRISFNAASDGLPAISPDGGEIVFVSNRGNQWGIWRVAIDSGRAESVAGDLGALPNWLEQSLDWAP